MPSRKPNLATIQTRRMPSPDLVKSTKLPSPCKTCGRPDLPERFHSHPATPLKLSPRKNQPVKETKVPGKWCFNCTTVKTLIKKCSLIYISVQSAKRDIFTYSFDYTQFWIDTRKKCIYLLILKHPVCLIIEVFLCCDLGISRSPSNIDSHEAIR